MIKEQFAELLSATKRKGIEQVIDMLEEKGFFEAPASSRFHLSCKGGLAEHSLNVYEAAIMLREQIIIKKPELEAQLPLESVAICALLHDVCKINVYKESVRNKKVNGEWVQVPFYEFDDKMPYGHGEKSVYMITPFMKLSREEAFAIRYHMGFSNDDPAKNVGYTFEHFPLAFALSTADMEATYFCDEQQ